MKPEYEITQMMICEFPNVRYPNMNKTNSLLPKCVQIFFTQMWTKPIYSSLPFCVIT